MGSAVYLDDMSDHRFYIHGLHIAAVRVLCSAGQVLEKSTV